MFKGLAGKLFGSASAPEAFSKDTLRPLIRRRAEWLLEATGPRPGSWEPAIMLPDRNHLMFANANDQQAVHAMVEAAEAIYEKSDGPLSMQPLVRRNNDLVPLALTASAHDTVRRQVLNALVLAYEAQGRPYRHDGGPVFQKLYVTANKDDGALRSTAVWASGWDTFAPKADQMFFKVDDLEMWVPWDKAAAVIGLTEAPGMWPPRYRYAAVLSNEQYAELKTVASYTNQPS
jgi:hypothetical protein